MSSYNSIARPEKITSANMVNTVNALNKMPDLDLKTMVLINYNYSIAMLIKAGNEGFDSDSINASAIAVVSLVSIVVPQLDKTSDKEIRAELNDLSMKLTNRMINNSNGLSDKVVRMRTVGYCLRAMSLLAEKFKAFGMKIERKVSAVM